LSPVELGLGARRCNAGEYSIAIEPNGDVLPCQSYYTPVGNILRDRWSTIWHSPLLRSFRDRVADPRGSGLPPECWDCPELPLCGGGCRIERERGKAQDDPERAALPAAARSGTADSKSTVRVREPNHESQTIVE
jgi:radical SAM protein with 4Fe4S-binding SPASM domain